MNINAVCNSLYQELKQNYPNYEFSVIKNYVDGRGKNIRDIIACESFESKYVDLEIRIFEDRVLIYIQLKNQEWSVKHKVYSLLYDRKHEIESCFPDGILDWGGTLKRVIVFVNKGGPYQHEYPMFFKSESDLVKVVFGYIEIAIAEIISRINQINDLISNQTLK